MRRIKIGIIGAGALSEWGILPTIVGPEAMAPPDEGAWWSRRPSTNAKINWQPSVRPEVVAIAEPDETRRARLAAMFRIAAQYSNARTMLTENALDVVMCEELSGINAPDLIADMATRGAKYLWLGSVPAASSSEALELAYWANAHGVSVWCSRPTPRAAAHRAALQLIKRGEIGDITALTLRWSTPFCSTRESEPMLSSATFAALDLLMTCAGSAPTTTMLRESKSTSHLWLGFASGAAASAVFASADNWNTPLPRLEICGTQGRFLVCEAGRRMGFFQPHEAARWIEPPGLASHVSSSNVVGLGEDIKAFLAECTEQKSEVDNSDWLHVARVLALGEAAQSSLDSATLAEVPTLRFEMALRESRNGVSTPTRPVTSPLILPLHT